MSRIERIAFENAYSRSYTRGFRPRGYNYNQAVWSWRVASRYAALVVKAVRA